MSNRTPESRLRLDPPHHIAVVGAGFTGTSVLVQLSTAAFPVRTITVFEKGTDPGPGYPYCRDESEDYLVNNTADSMSVDPQEPSTFVEWLRGRPDLVSAFDPKAHLPRRWFGEYLHHEHQRALRALADAGIRVEVVSEEVVDIEPSKGGWILHHGTIAPRKTRADRVILATGRLPERNLCDEPPEGSKAALVSSHIPAGRLDGIPIDATCHVLGASLSAYDVVNRLFSEKTGCFLRGDDSGEFAFVPNGNERRLVLCSRTAHLKKMQNRSPAKIVRRRFTVDTVRDLAAKGALSIAELARMIHEDVAEAGFAIHWGALLDPYGPDGLYGECRTEDELNATAQRILEADLRAARGGEPSLHSYLVDYLDDARDVLWEVFASGALRLVDELRYRREFETTLLSYFAACPIETGERILALMKAGRLRLVRGVSSVEFDRERDAYCIRCEGGVEYAKLLIQTTGSVERDVESPRQPAWLRSLVRRGLLRPYEKEGMRLPGAAVDMATCSLPRAPGVYLANQLLWGPGFFVSSARTMATIVQRILADIYS